VLLAIVVLIIVGVAIWYFATQTGDDGDTTPTTTGPTASQTVSPTPTG
jgi:hypothetical protein